MKKNFSTIFISFSLILCLTFSSVISTYTSAYIVKADEGVDVAYDIIMVILCCVGMTVAPEVSIPAACVGITDAVKLGFDEYEFQMKNNGDGTATIKADDIQMIADIAQASNGFGDSYYDQIGTKGDYTYYGALSIDHRPGTNSHVRASGRLSSEYPIVIYLTKNGSSDSHVPYYYLVKSSVEYGSPIAFSTRGYQLYNGKYTYFSFANYGWYPPGDETGSFISNAPVFLKQSDALEYIRTGDNAKDALNYNPELNANFRYGTNYSPIYNGGDFTFNLNQLNNFTSYYTQVINNYPNSSDTDKVLQILLNYLKGDSYDLSISRVDNNILQEGEQNTIDVEILTNIENPDYNAYLTWHGIGIDSVTYNGSIATLALSDDIHGGTYDLSAVYDNNDDIYIISSNLTMTVKEIEQGEIKPPETEPPELETEVTESIKETNSWLQKIYIRLGEFKKEVKKQLDEVIKQLKKIRRWTALDTIIDGADAISDIIQFITDLLDPDKAVDAVTDFVATGMDAFNDIKLLIDGKFPFCIPVDILTLMQTLAHEPEPPRFEIPLVLERYGINEKLVIDFSDFEYISKISRTFLTISWCFALMNVTTKITDMKSI